MQFLIYAYFPCYWNRLKYENVRPAGLYVRRGGHMFFKASLRVCWELFYGSFFFFIVVLGQCQSASLESTFYSLRRFPGIRKLMRIKKKGGKFRVSMPRAARARVSPLQKNVCLVYHHQQWSGVKAVFSSPRPTDIRAKEGRRLERRPCKQAISRTGGWWEGGKTKGAFILSQKKVGQWEVE